MAFPDSAVIDNFNRVDAASLGANWTVDVYAVNDETPYIATNQVNFTVAAASSAFGSAWQAQSSSGDLFQVSFDLFSLASQSGAEMAVGLVESGGAGSAAADGYEFRLRYLADALINRIVNGVATQLGATVTPGSHTGWGIQFNRVTGEIIVFYNDSGVWATLTTRTDGTPISMSAAYGYLSALMGASQTGLADDFRVGAFQAPQYQYPTAVVAAGSWAAVGAATLWEATDEVTPSVTDYAESPDATATGHEMKLRLGALTDPNSGNGHYVRYRYLKNTDAGDTVNLVVTLYRADGTTAVATQTHTGITTTAVDGTLTLTVTEANSIPSADYATGLVIGFKEVKA